MVLAPEHPLVDAITTPDQRKAIEAYKNAGGGKSDLERTELARRRRASSPGLMPSTRSATSRTPVWIADYVLALRHRAIRRCRRTIARFRVCQAVRPPHPHGGSAAGRLLKATGSTVNDLKEAFVGDGAAMNSGPFDGLTPGSSKQRITAWLEERGLGTQKVNYKLRDWLFSRQRYWGEPFPILHEVDAQGKPTGVISRCPRGIAADAPRDGGLQAERPTGAAAGQGDRLGQRTAMASGISAKPTQCRSGPACWY